MTKLLAIETIGIRGSVACSENQLFLAQASLSSDQRSAQSLVPAIDLLLREQGWTPSSLDAVAVAVGPGSFTGLRVGVTAAKILSWSCHAKIYGVDTLLAAAYQTAAELPKLAADRTDSVLFQDFLKKRAAVVTFALDAQRGDVTVRDFLILANYLFPIPLQDRFSLISMAEWLGSARLDSFSPQRIAEILADLPKSFVTGSQDLSDQLPVFYAGPVLESRRALPLIRDDITSLPAECGTPTAKGVALAAFSSSQPDDPFTLLPVYSRESAAEEKRKQAK